VARLGGDEFVVVLSDIANEADIEQVASKLLSSLVQPYAIEGRDLVITSSIGISVYPNDGRDEGTLVKHADTAMYRAKERGRNAYVFYAPDMSQDARARLALESDLRRAIQRHELRLHFQPFVDAASGDVVGTEALLRWQHPSRGLLAPDAFLDLAEDSGLIVPIGDWVLREACRRNLEWQEAGLTTAPVAVNLSNRQFNQDNLVDHIRLLLAKTGLDPRLLELELTETIVMDRAESSIAPLHALRGIGVRLSIDDFGTGYSSLAYLKRFPLDVLKIDRSFVADIGVDPNVEAIIAAIAALGRKMNLEVVAEGVETSAQLEFLREQGCGRIQGYLVSPPLPAAQYAAFLAGWDGARLRTRGPAAHLQRSA
jgi:predicted signal transduction protein with EAL and GGDEF domain